MLSWGREWGFGVEDWRGEVSELLSLGHVGRRRMGVLRSWEGSRGLLGPGRWSFLGVCGWWCWSGAEEGKWEILVRLFGMWGTANVTQEISVGNLYPN